MAGKQKLDEISLAAVASTKGTSNENHNIKNPRNENQDCSDKIQMSLKQCTSEVENDVSEVEMRHWSGQQSSAACSSPGHAKSTQRVGSRTLPPTTKPNSGRKYNRCVQKVVAFTTTGLSLVSKIRLQEYIPANLRNLNRVN